MQRCVIVLGGRGEFTGSARQGMLNVEEQPKPTDVLGGRLDTFLRPNQQASCSSSQTSYEEDPLNTKKDRERSWEKKRLDSRRLGLT